VLAIAKIIRSDGTLGDLLVSSAYDLKEFNSEEPVFIPFDGLQVPFFVQSLRPKGGKYIIHLNDIDNLTDAEEVVGSEIFAEVEEEDDGLLDFTGWTIQNNGTTVGVCTGLEPIPGNPCLYIETPDQKDTLIPLHEDFIISIDEATQTLNLNLPQGLID